MNPNWFSNGSKYNAKKVEYNGMTFDSKRELKRYKELELLQEAGEIKNLQRQVKYVLIPAQREPDIIGKRGGVKKGKTIEKECTYVADFVYEEDGSDCNVGAWGRKGLSGARWQKRADHVHL